MKLRILFQGDSITDAGRDRSDPHNMGPGYPMYASAIIAARYPDIEFEFVNLGMSGNRAEHLVDRWRTDALDIKPDIVSVLIGVNDCWFFESKEAKMTDEYFEYCLRRILSQLRDGTEAKILMVEPFLIGSPNLPAIGEDVDRKRAVFDRVAEEYADAFVPMQSIFRKAEEEREPTYWSEDGIHPTPEGAKLLGSYYADAACEIINGILKDRAI